MIRLEYIIVILIIIIASCSSRPDNEVVQSNIAAEKSAILTEADPVQIKPLTAIKGTILHLRTHGSLMNKSRIQWLVNDVPDEFAQSNWFDTGKLTKGETVMVAVIKGNEEYHSNEVVIGNTPPYIISAKLFPELPSAVSSFTTEVRGSDIDDDYMAYKYKWSVNGQYRGDDSYLETDLIRGDIVSVEISPVDREDTGKSVKLNREILNAQPIVTESNPVFHGSTYSHRIAVSDPDGDTLTYTLKKGPKGMSIDESGMLTWKVKSDDSGDHDIEVLINDNNGAEILLPISTSINITEYLSDSRIVASSISRGQ